MGQDGGRGDDRRYIPHLRGDHSRICGILDHVCDMDRGAVRPAALGQLQIHTLPILSSGAGHGG